MASGKRTDPATRRAVERLLPVMSKLQIAKIQGVSRETVLQIERDKKNAEAAELLKNRQQ